MQTITTEAIPILVWGDVIDEDTLEQARHLANLPFAFDHVALMPDAHVGYGMPIGGVFAAEGQVVPHAVGLDIGCGMRAWRTNITLRDLDPVRDRILNDIQRSVPTGFEWHKTSQAERTTIFDEMPDIPPLVEERAKAEKQLGSLGGGNHFLELQVDPDGIVWAMVHSGSRNIGKQMGTHYDRAARAEASRIGSTVPPDWGLAHLPVDSDLGREYLAVMTWCMRFAEENRRLMAEAIERAIDRHFPDAVADSHVAVHHNYASFEEHLGKQVVVHRKGAVHACGSVIIPGSMGSVSYIGDGLCNPLSFESCAHGAGRQMGRKAALRAIPTEHVIQQLRELDVHLFKVKKGDVAEEAPEAYKDIEAVMTQQADLVARRVRLTPIGVVKG